MSYSWQFFNFVAPILGTVRTLAYFFFYSACLTVGFYLLFYFDFCGNLNFTEVNFVDGYNFEV